MTAARRTGTALAATVALAVAVAVSPRATAQEPNCPENSGNPRCSDEAGQPGPPPGGGRPGPATPPGQGGTPAGPTPAQPPADQPPAAPPGDDAPAGPPPADGPAGGGLPGQPTAPGGQGPTTSGPTPAAPLPDASPPPPPPPPDLGPRRTLRTRLVTSADGTTARVRVRVIEERARGVDSGWTVTVTGAPAAAPLQVRSRPFEDAAQAGVLLAGDVFGGGAPGPLFTVVGQRSTDAYDAVYTGILALRPVGEAPTTITVTLFQ